MSVQTEQKGSAGTIYLVVIQVVSRGLTFIGNQTLLRFVSPEHLGLAVQLEALSISILYTARESLRVALQRRATAQDQSSAVRSQLAVNAAYLVVVIGVLLGTFLSSLYRYSVDTGLAQRKSFNIAFWLYGISTFLELLAEPCFVVIQQNALFRERARAETTAAVTRCIAACGFALYMNGTDMGQSVLPFAVGQFGYGLSLFAVYFRSASLMTSTAGFSLLPRRLVGVSDLAFSLLPRSLLRLAGAFYGQSIFKWLLTQGDTLVLSLFADLQSQGIFALASNYGGLASRLLFQPMEESSRNVFGDLVPSTDTPVIQSTRSPIKSTTTSAKRDQALEYLSTIVRGYLLLIAIPCTTLLPLIFPILVNTLLGSRSQWSSAQTSALLSAYSYYIPCLAINGILDAFVTSVATETELGAQSLMMVGVTFIYLSTAYIAMAVLDLGATGLVYANILNMLLRIVFSIWFIRAWTGRNTSEPRLNKEASSFMRFVKKSIPSKSCLCTSVLVTLALHNQSHIKSVLAHRGTLASLSGSRISILDMDLFDLSLATSAAALLASSIILTEREFLLAALQPLLPARVKAIVEKYLRPLNKK